MGSENKFHTTYLFISRKRILGYCSVELIASAYTLYSANDRSSEPIQKPTMMGVRQIWCHGNYRKKGIASKLVNCAREKFVFGCCIPIENLAFSSPTSDGYLFSKKFSGKDMPLVYDITSVL